MINIKKLSLLSLAISLSSFSFADDSVSKKEYLKFKSHDHDVIEFENGKKLPYKIISRNIKGNLEIISAKIDDPLQADLASYNNLIVTLDNDKQELQGFAETSDGHFQLNPKSAYPVWSKINKPVNVDSIIPSASSKLRQQKISAAPAIAPLAAADGEKDANGNYVIDVFMGFSDQAAARINNNIQAYAQMQVETVNTALKNSNIQGVYLRLVGVGTTPNNPGIIWQPEHLNPLSQVKVWFKDEIARLQPDLIGIQQVQTGAPGSAGGWAGVGGDSDTQVVDIDLPGAWRHEVGHNVGGLHCKESGNTGYNYGHSVRQGRGTAMCGNDLAYYSSPLIRDNEGNVLGSANDADMARVWRERMAELAARRIHTVPYGSETSIPATLQAEDYVYFSDTTPGNAGGAYRKDDVDIEATSDAGGGYNLGWTAPGEWLTYNISVPTDGLYEFSYRVASQSSGGTIQLEKAGGTPVYGSVTFPSTGGWQNWTTVRHVVSLKAGNQSIGLVMKTGGFNLNWVAVDKVTLGAGVYNIQNRWLSDQSINIASGKLASSSVAATLPASQWTFERIPGSDIYRIRSKSQPNLYLNIETGVLNASQINAGWVSAQWSLIPVAEAPGYFRIQNRWKPDQYINVENGLQASAAQSGWWSAMWRLPFVSAQ